MAGYAVAHLDEIDELSDGGCLYRPVRHHFGITSFGATAWTAVRRATSSTSTTRATRLQIRSSSSCCEATPCSSSKVTGSTRRPERSCSPLPARSEGVRQGGGTTIIMLEGTPGKAYEPVAGKLGSARPALRVGGVRRGRRPSTRPGRSHSAVPLAVLQPRLLREPHRPDERRARTPPASDRHVRGVSPVGTKTTRTWIRSATNQRSSN